MKKKRWIDPDQCSVCYGTGLSADGTHDCRICGGSGASAVALERGRWWLEQLGYVRQEQRD